MTDTRQHYIGPKEFYASKLKICMTLLNSTATIRAKNMAQNQENCYLCRRDNIGQGRGPVDPRTFQCTKKEAELDANRLALNKLLSKLWKK
jgi:hypothetical protein